MQVVARGAPGTSKPNSAQGGLLGPSAVVHTTGLLCQRYFFDKVLNLLMWSSPALALTDDFNRSVSSWLERQS